MKKDQIIEESLTLFANKGYFGTSMDDIANAVGIKKASLYSHYKGKESIFKAVFDFILEDYAMFINKLTADDRNLNSHEKLRNIFLNYVKNCKDNNRMIFWDRYYYYPPEYLKDYILDKTYEIEMQFIKKINTVIEAGIIRQEITNKNAQNIALSFYYMMIGLAMTVKFYHEQEIERDIDNCTTVFLDGIRP
jgi:Transcriptional regulator